MKEPDYEELVIDALIDTLVLLYESGYVKSKKCEVIEAISNETFIEWTSKQKPLM